MAKKKGRRGGVYPVKINLAITLAALADGAIKVQVAPDSVVNKVWAVSADLKWSIRDLTAGEGPIIVGFAHSDYSDAEITEALNATGSWDRSDKVTMEQARRFVREAAAFSGAAEEVLNDGKAIRTRIGFYIEDGKTLDFWAVNESGATLTTGGVIRVKGTVWLRST